MSCAKDSVPVFASRIFSLGKGVLVVDPQEDVLLRVCGDSGLSSVTSCTFLKVEACKHVHSELVDPDVAAAAAAAVLATFPFPDDNVEEWMLSSSRNVPFPTGGMCPCSVEVFSRKLLLCEKKAGGTLCLLLEPFLPSLGSPERVSRLEVGRLGALITLLLGQPKL